VNQTPRVSGNSKRFEAIAVLTDSDAASALEVACGSDASDQPVVSVCRFERTAVRGNDERLIRALWPLPSQQASEVSWMLSQVIICEAVILLRLRIWCIASESTVILEMGRAYVTHPLHC
jgi:hypothetical protein